MPRKRAVEHDDAEVALAEPGTAAQHTAPEAPGLRRRPHLEKGGGMTPQDVQQLVALIGRYYPGAFHPPAIEQRTLWFDDLDGYDVPTAQEALRRWVRWHGAMPPELGDLVHLCRQVDSETTRWQSTAAALPLVRTPDQATLLQHMAKLHQRMLGTWVDDAGQQHGRLTLRQAARLCHRWSARYGQRPALAHDFAMLAVEYASMAAREEVSYVPEEHC